MSGQEMLLNTVVKSLGIKPEDIKSAIRYVLDTVKNNDERLSRIETKLDLAIGKMTELQAPELPVSDCSESLLAIVSQIGK